MSETIQHFEQKWKENVKSSVQKKDENMQKSTKIRLYLDVLHFP